MKPQEVKPKGADRLVLYKGMPYLVRFSRSQIERMPGLCSLQM